MNRRGLLVRTLVTLVTMGQVGCGHEEPAQTDSDVHLRTLVDGSVERWTVDENDVAHGDYRLETAQGWLLREGSFRHGQLHGLWTDWYPPELLPSAQPQRAMTYGFVAGFAEGAFTAWEVDGTLRWERSWAGGRPCGLWKTFGDAESETLYPPCDGVVQVELESLTLVSPLVTDFGWDAQTCPSGTTLIQGAYPTSPTSPNDSTATYCTRSDLPEGPFMRRSPDGFVVEVGTFVAGERSGLWVRYHPRETEPGNTGQRVAEAGEYSAGLRQGTWFSYRPDGTLEHKGGYRDDQRHGSWDGYAPHLLRTWSGEYDAGQKTGLWRAWYSELAGGSTYAGAGTLATEETWVDGVRQGPFMHWFRAGGKEREGAYVSGAWNGVVNTWWESGTQRFETTYAGGIANGPHRQWDEQGRLEAQGRYAFGLADGPWTTWSDPNFVIAFFGGPTTRTRQSATFVDGVVDGPIEGRYDEGGALAFESHAVRGFDEGPGTFYWSSGAVLAEGFYQGGGAQGPWQTYYESGAERATWPYVNNVLSGPFVEYHDNGQKKREGAYNSGQRIGVWTSWDEAGVVTRSEDCGPVGEACDCSVTEDCR